MKKITPDNLPVLLAEALAKKDMATILDALVQFLRRGGIRRAGQRFDLLLDVLRRDSELRHCLAAVFTNGWAVYTFIRPWSVWAFFRAAVLHAKSVSESMNALCRRLRI